MGRRKLDVGMGEPIETEEVATVDQLTASCWCRLWRYVVLDYDGINQMLKCKPMRRKLQLVCIV